jgi:predicted component of type VI protein secretion system
MVLDPPAVNASADAIRVESPPGSTNPPINLSSNTTMPQQKRPPIAAQEPAPAASNAPNAAPNPIEQAERLHTALRAALGATGELVRSLKRHKRQERLGKSTLESLKQLQNVA